MIEAYFLRVNKYGEFGSCQEDLFLRKFNSIEDYVKFTMSSSNIKRVTDNLTIDQRVSYLNKVRSVYLKRLRSLGNNCNGIH